MTGSINNNYGAVIDGAGRAMDGMSTRTDGKSAAPGVDPRLTSAVEDTSAQGRAGRDKVRAAGDKTGRYTKDLADLQDRSGRDVRGIGGEGKSSMPSMPTVPQSGQTQATPAPVPAAAAPAPMPAPSAPSAPPPSGLSTIDPQLLQALVDASKERAEQDAANGVFPNLPGDPASASSATTPQRPQPLDVSQVSLEKHPGGQMTPQQTAAVIDQALTINGVPNDPTLRAQWQALYQHMAEGESARNPNAANNSDSNATGMMMSDGAHANSSRGAWQCIPTTFAAYHMAGTSTSIYDPVASAAASMNYVMNTYHVSPDGAGLEAFAQRRGVGTASYTGY